MDIHTIGFTRRTAEDFFVTLERAGVRRVVDIRLNNTSQLAAFAKKDDLAFFLRRVSDIEYVHEPLLSPTQDILDDFKKKKGDWSEYERRFNALLAERKVEKNLDRALFGVPAALLCSEYEPDRCHRRLVCEYLAKHWKNVRAIHL